MRINFEPSRMIPAENAKFQPIQNARITTKVFMEKGRLKMQIHKKPIMAEELI